MKLDGFYKKYVNANGYPIVGSEKVSDYALFEAAYLVSLMLAERPDVRDAMVRSTSRLVVMAYDEYTTDVPEHRQLTPKNYWTGARAGWAVHRPILFAPAPRKTCSRFPAIPIRPSAS
jgi:hypothetical protein